jgi:hypothetical protein
MHVHTTRNRLWGKRVYGMLQSVSATIANTTKKNHSATTTAMVMQMIIAASRRHPM